MFITCRWRASTTNGCAGRCRRIGFGTSSIWTIFLFFLLLPFSRISRLHPTLPLLFLVCIFSLGCLFASICVQCHKNKKPNPNKINATIFSNSDRCVSSPSATPNSPPGSGTERERRKLAANRSHNSPVHQRYVEVDCLVMSCVPQWAQWAWQVWHVHARASLDRWTPDAGGQDALGADLHRWEKQRLTWVLA